MRDRQDLRNDLNWPDKTKLSTCKALRVWTKNEENFQENFEIFLSKSLWKIDFFTFFTKCFLDFWLLPESIYLWKIISDFYINFSDFGGGGRSNILYTSLALSLHYNVPKHQPQANKFCCYSFLVGQMKNFHLIDEEYSLL